MNTSSTDLHKRMGDRLGPIPLAIVTVSDTRTPETDINGHFLRERIDATSNSLIAYRIVPDDPALISTTLAELAPLARVILFNGGTGISHRDNTFDALSSALEKTIPGFGELFRMLSYEQVGAAAMLSRATAGVYRGAVVISTPGSPAAVRLAWERLIEPELGHLAWELTR
jgi:molybdopterin adenylyltransferase